MSDNYVQVLLYTSYLHIIGGIETFVFNFVELMREYYDIGIYCPQLPGETAGRLSYKVPVFRNPEHIDCDTLIMIRVMDDIPSNVSYKRSVRMCHATRSDPSWHILDDCDKVVHVSKASKKTFESDGMVIYNPLVKNTKRALLFVSATRIPAADKGKNADRMLELAWQLNYKAIPFLWFNFSDAPLKDAPPGFVNVGTFQELQPYISRADYLVQLSDQEGFGYSVAEALISGTAVICTPFSTTKELGVLDGVNGYIIPFDMNFDVRKLLDVPVFEYEYDNTKIVSQWKRILGKPHPTHSYDVGDLVQIEVTMDYRDTQFNKVFKRGMVLTMPRDRAEVIMTAGFCKILEKN